MTVPSHGVGLDLEGVEPGERSHYVSMVRFSAWNRRERERLCEHGVRKERKGVGLDMEREVRVSAWNGRGRG